METVKNFIFVLITASLTLVINYFVRRIALKQPKDGTFRHHVKYKLVLWPDAWPHALGAVLASLMAVYLFFAPLFPVRNGASKLVPELLRISLCTAIDSNVHPTLAGVVAPSLLTICILAILICAYWIFAWGDYGTKGKLKESEKEKTKLKEDLDACQYRLSACEAQQADKIVREWGKLHGDAQITAPPKGLKIFCSEVFAVLENRSISGTQQDSDSFELESLKLATNTPLLFSLQSRSYIPYSDRIDEMGDWQKIFCQRLIELLRLPETRESLREFQWIHLYPEIVRSRLWWFPMKTDRKFEQWESDHGKFFEDVRKVLPARCNPDSWSSYETSMLPIVIVVIGLKNTTTDTHEKVAFLGLADLLHAEKKKSDFYEEAKWQEDNFTWLRTSDHNIVAFFESVQKRLEFQNNRIIRAVQELLSGCEPRGLDVMFQVAYESGLHEDLIQESRISHVIYSKPRLEEIG